uniref:Uncharacterized protein n=1 Tax=Arcella intermedia TaxID=1963864 RepID=A0A6B2LAG6_9EUKA
MVLFSCESHSQLSKNLISISKGSVVPGDITWGCFEDEFPNLMINDVQSIRSKNSIILLDFLDLKKIFAQLSAIYAIPRYFVKSLTIVLPYFPTGTMERIDEEGQIATAMTLARLLSATPPTTFGPPRIIIYDIHALQERFYFGDSVVPILSTAIPTFIRKLRASHKNEQIAIAFPDEGAWKRFHKQFESFNLIICTKVRDGDKRIVSVGEGNEYCKDRHVFIVDDLVKTGGTLIECNKALRNFGAKHVSAFVTHAVFPKRSWERFTKAPADQRFENFYITNSCPTTVAEINDQSPFHVLDLAEDLLDLLTSHRH